MLARSMDEDKVRDEEVPSSFVASVVRETKLQVHR